MIVILSKAKEPKRRSGSFGRMRSLRMTPDGQLRCRRSPVPCSLYLNPINSPTYSNSCRYGPRGVIPGMPEVIIHDDESFERALKRFKKKCEKAGILSDLRKHRHFEKPSEKRKRKMNAAVRKNRRGPRVPRA
jgi:small subunit ribosomal protein S21